MSFISHFCTFPSLLPSLLFQPYMLPMLQTVLFHPTFLVKMSLILCPYSGLYLLLGLFPCLLRLWLILVPLAPYLLICFPPSISITHNQNLPSCSFITPKIVPPFVSTSLAPCSSLFPRKLGGAHSVRGKSSWKCSSRGKPPRGRGRGSRTLSGHSPYSNSDSHKFFFSHTSPMFSQGYLSGDGALDLSTRPRVCSYSPQDPTVNPFFINYFCSPKIFSPIVSFNEPSEYVLNIHVFFYLYLQLFPWPGQQIPAGLCY